MRPFEKSTGVFLTSFLRFDIVQASEVCTLPERFKTPQKTNFKTCYDNIQNLTIDERIDSQCFDGGVEGGVFLLSVVGRSYAERVLTFGNGRIYSIGFRFWFCPRQSWMQTSVSLHWDSIHISFCCSSYWKSVRQVSEPLDTAYITY